MSCECSRFKSVKLIKLTIVYSQYQYYCKYNTFRLKQEIDTRVNLYKVVATYNVFIIYTHNTDYMFDTFIQDDTCHIAYNL